MWFPPIRNYIFLLNSGQFKHFCQTYQYYVFNERDQLLPHLMGKELGTENMVHSKLANPRLLEGQVEVSPWHHSVTQVVSHVAWFTVSEHRVASLGHFWGEREKKIFPWNSCPLSFGTQRAFLPLRCMHVKVAKSTRLSWLTSKFFASISSSFPNLNQYFYVYICIYFLFIDSVFILFPPLNCEIPEGKNHV